MLNAPESERARFGLHRGGQTEAWKADARFKVIAAGRRWGKTHFGRTWLFRQAFKRGAGRYWYVAPTREDAKDIMWNDLKAACHPSWLAEAPREQDLALRLVNGAEVRLWSAEKGDSLRGRSLQALVMDEYADMAGEMFHEVLRPSLTDYRAPALFIGTPKSHNHYYELWVRGQGGDPAWRAWRSFQFKSIDNPLFDPAELEEARRTTDPRTFRQEYEASFESIAGRAYYAFDRAKHVAPVELRRDLPVCLTFDFNHNPATCVIGQRVRDHVVVWREVFLTERGGEATEASARTAKALLDGIHWQGGVRLYGDSTGQNTKTTGPSDHEMIRSVFPGAAWCIPSKQPHPRDRIQAVNSKCFTMAGGTFLTIDPQCHKLCSDLEQVVFAANGDLDQKTNPMLTHISDAFGYWLVYEWPPAKRGGVAVANHWWVG